MKKQTAVIKVLLSLMILFLLLVTYIGYRYFVSAHQKSAFIKPITATETISGSNQPDTAQHSNNTKRTSAVQSKKPSKITSNTKSPTSANKNAATSNNSNQNKSSSTNKKSKQPSANVQTSKPLTGQALQESQKKKQADKQAATQKASPNTNIEQPADPQDAVAPTIGITAPTAPAAPVIQTPKP